MVDALRVMAVFGSGFDAVRMAPVVRALEVRPEIHPIVCLAGTRQDRLDEMLRLFSIRTDYDVSTGCADATELRSAGRILTAMERVFDDARPDVVLVHDDATAGDAVALAAFYGHIPVGHIEAGLPREARLTGNLATFHFTPTRAARETLVREHIAPASIAITGSTAIDAFLSVAENPKLPLPPRWNELEPGRPVVLVTARRHDRGAPVRDLCAALQAIAALPTRPQIYWPLHPSPRVRPVAHDLLGGMPGIVLAGPIGYAQTVAAALRSSIVMSDAESLEEAAPCHGKPAFVIRGEREAAQAPAVAAALLGSASNGDGRRENPYGDGRAAARIAQWLLARYRGQRFPEPFGLLAIA